MNPPGFAWRVGFKQKGSRKRGAFVGKKLVTVFSAITLACCVLAYLGIQGRG